MSRVPDPNGRNQAAKPAEKEADLQGAAELLGSPRKAEVLATLYGWSPDRARGYVDGVACRMSGNRPSKYMLVGIDQYALGFRAGYYNR